MLTGPIVMMIRLGNNENAVLCASSDPTDHGPGVAAISLEGTDLAAVPAVIEWSIAPSENAKMPISDGYVMEIEAVTTGDAPVTIMTHRWATLPDVAVRR